MNPHHETNPHFLTVPSQLPGHDHDHCPTDVVLPVSIPKDEDHHHHQVPTVPVPRSSSTNTMQPSTEDPDLLYPRRLWTPRTAYPDLVDHVRAIREKQHGETNPHMHRKPEQVKVVDPNRETNPHFYRNPVQVVAVNQPHRETEEDQHYPHPLVDIIRCTIKEKQHRETNPHFDRKPEEIELEVVKQPLPHLETKPHFYGDPKQQVEVVNPRHDNDPDMHARSPPSPQHQAPVPLALLPLHLHDQTHQPLRPHHQDQPYGSLAPHRDDHFPWPHGPEPRHKGRHPHHPPLLPRQQRERHAPGVPPLLTPRHHGPDRLTEPLQQHGHDQYYQHFQPRTERFPRDLLGAVPLQTKEDEDQVSDPDLIRAIIEKRHPGTNPHFDRKPEPQEVPHRATNPHFLRSMQPPAEDEDLRRPRPRRPRQLRPPRTDPDLIRAIIEKRHPETNPHFDIKPERQVHHPETNPHFLRPTQPLAEDQDLRRPGWLRPPRTEHPPRDPVLAVQLPEDQDHDHDQVLIPEVPKAPLQPCDSAEQPHQPRLDQQRHRRQTLEVLYDRQLVRQKRVHPCAACSAVIFCVFLTLAALAVFIIYLIFRRWGPRFEVSTVTTLNGLNLTTKGGLLSANLTLVANFTNPNKKAGVEFKHIVVELYFGTTIIATKYIEPDLSAPKGGTRSVEVDMVASGVQLSEVENEIRRLKRQMVKDRVVFEVRVTFLVHTKFGRLVRYSYWMRGQCIFVLKKPPHGVLLSTRCTTKRHQNFV